jgi:putative oxidoreductase
MNILFLIGRIAFVAIFLVSGIYILMDLDSTATLIQSKITIPDFLQSAATNAQSITGMPPYKLLAIAVASIEILFALLIIFNLITRFSALVLLIYVGVQTYFLHDFWNMAPPAKAVEQEIALRNLAIMGGLLMLMVLGAWRAGVGDDDDYPA